MFLVDVKGLREDSVWFVRRKPPRNKLFYVFAVVSTERLNRFFIVTQKQVHRILDDKLKRKLKRMPLGQRKRGEIRLRKTEGAGSQSEAISPYENKWKALPK
jgi:hypothetical protein